MSEAMHVSAADFKDAVWRKSSRSGTGSNGACVEVASFASAFGVRDSKNPDAAVLLFPARPWSAFLAVVR
jgi:hypothetical protein